MDSYSTGWNAHDGPAEGAIDRAIDVLEAVIWAGRETSLAAVAQKTQLPKPTVHRLLSAWVKRRYIALTGHGRYGPGPQLFTAAGLANASLDYSRVAQPYLNSLHRVTDDTIHLAILIGGIPIYVDKLDGRRPYRMASQVGMPLPFHSTAIGKAILAMLPEAELDATLVALRLTPYTSRTLATRHDLNVCLTEVRKQGYALDDEENELGVRCVGAPVFGYQQRVLGAVSISAPAAILSLDQAAAMAPPLRQAAKDISLALGASA
jgi:DNA-binding IclR family transcriptional regulator